MLIKKHTNFAVVILTPPLAGEESLAKASSERTSDVLKQVQRSFVVSLLRMTGSAKLVKHSFSLIEVLVFSSILGIFFIMATSVATVSLRNMKYNEHKIMASHYSRQLEDWLRVQKEIDWGGQLCDGCVSPSNFTQLVTQQGNAADNYLTKFCFDQSPILSSWPLANSLGCNGVYSLGSIFSREVEFTSSQVGGFVNQVNATITASWLELGQLKNVTSKTVFSALEQ
ncbi:hypothetical protein HY612_02245 [Candidatus Roizmanbacteria bacterium]|nr:hypothetical protein [Candidatus Roizmanbacteria bacterium]